MTRTLVVRSVDISLVWAILLLDCLTNEYVEYLSAVKFNYTIRLYQCSSTNYKAMLNFVQSVV